MWLLMPSVLLVRQIPYRALSLGLKVVIRRWSRLSFAVLCGFGACSDLQLVRTILDSTGFSLGRDWLGWARALFSDGLLDCSHPSVLTAWSVGAMVSFQMVSWVVAACPIPGGFPPVNVVNRAYQMYRLRMPIWSFYDKTYIVITYLYI